MSRIPKFQQRKLASELVGTPGVDTSGETNFRNAAAAVQSIADTFGALAVKRQTAVDKASANDTLIDFQIALQRAGQEQATEFAGSTITPTERVEILKKKSDDLFRAAEESLATPEAKALFTAGAQTTIRRRLLDEGKIASDNQVLVANDRMVTGQNKVAGSLYEFSKDPIRSYQDKKDELLFATQEGSLPNIEISRDILGDKEADDFAKKSLEGNYRAVLAGMLEIAPDQAIELLEDPDFSQILTVEERAKELKTAETRATDFTKLTDKREKIAIFQDRAELTRRLRDGTLTLGEVEQISDDRARRAFRGALLEFNPLTPSQITRMSTAIQVRWERLFEQNKDGTFSDILKDDTTIAEVLKVQELYMDGFANGVVTKDRLIKASAAIPDIIAQALDNKKSFKLSAFIQGLNRFAQVGFAFSGFEGVPGSLAGVGFGGPAAAGASITESDEIRSQLTDNYLDKFEGIDFEDQEAVTRVIDGVVLEYQRARNANRRDRKKGDPISVNGRAAVITFIHDDGEPDIEFV